MKNRIYTLLILIAVLLQSCRTTIPETDERNPTFSFKITGDGFDRIFTQDDDYSLFQLNLRKDVEYAIIFAAGDHNGTKIIQWQLPTQEVIKFTTDIDTPWISNDVTPEIRTLQWRGNPSAPINWYIFENRFIPNGNDRFVRFWFWVSDFGPGTGSTNTVSKVLSINIGDHETEVVPR